MGAIVAIMGEAGDPEIPERLERMLARSPYRGTPKSHFENGVAIAIQTRGWDASLATAGNWTVAVHGVIGNWPELAPTHSWDFPNGASNAYKLAIAYENLGKALFNKLRGEYSVLIYDRRARQLVAVRDFWGQRPLFFEQSRSRTYIASEIRQIRAGSQTPTEVDADAFIRDILWQSWSPEKTHVEGIRRFPAGVVLKVSRECDDLSLLAKTWEPPTDTLDCYDFRDLTEELTFLIDRAIDRWLIGVPFAVSMSGGVDSSTIWWAINQRASSGDSRAELGEPFSHIIPGHRFDEGPQIERILSATDSRGNILDYSGHDPVAAIFDNVERIDSLLLGALLFGTRFYRMIREDGRELMLDGFGGDNLLGGSSSYIIDLLKSGRIPLAIHDLFTYKLLPGQSRLGFIQMHSTGPLLRRVRRQFSTPAREDSPVWLHPSRKTQALDTTQSAFQADPEPWMTSRHIGILKDIEARQNQCRIDSFEQFLESEGLAFGSPLIDLDILDFAWKTPSRALTNGRQYKSLLRNVAYESLSQEIADWENPYPYVDFRPDEIDALVSGLPIQSWLLCTNEIVDIEGLRQLIAMSKVDEIASHEFGTLAVAELVVRNLTCPK